MSENSLSSNKSIKMLDGENLVTFEGDDKEKIKKKIDSILPQLY